jgi:hypothetical protein
MDQTISLSAAAYLARNVIPRSRERARVVAVVLGHVPDQKTKHQDRYENRAHQTAVQQFFSTLSKLNIVFVGGSYSGRPSY